ncbi:MAG: hypothetical protein IJ403_04085 [Oscillospiraceae bacterium]|nr:hypothetical protein [Oscillospiraceae bacterium]
MSGGLFARDGLTIVLNLILLAACVATFLFVNQKKKAAKAADEEATKAAIAAFQKEQKEQAEKYARDTKAYQDALPSYEQAKATFLQDYTKWREIYLAHLAEEARIEEQLEKDRLAGQKKIYAEEYTPAQDYLESCNNLLTEKYLPAADVLIDLLRSGRADDLKEAINLLEDMLYRERQLELQREQEQQRQREDKALLNEQRRKNNMDARVAEESKQKRCMYCAYQSRCGVKTSDGAYNCTGFRPR